MSNTIDAIEQSLTVQADEAISENGYPLRSSRYYMLWFGLMSVLYGAGSMASACSTSRKNSLQRALDLRRLNRNVNSSR